MSAEAAFERIAAAGGERIEPPTLLEARWITELTGEAIRSRLCTFTTDAGVEMCLRPDLTIPIAREVAMGARRIRYNAMGPVFRLPLPGSDEPIEHLQAGFEWFAGGGPEEDAEALVVALEAAQAGGAKAVDVRFGDVALYSAVVDALKLDDLWKQRLKRAFATGKGPRELLAAAASGQLDPHPLSRSLAAMEEADAVRSVEDMLAASGFSIIGGRSAADIAVRLRAKATETRPDPAAAAAIGRYLDITEPAGSVLTRLAAFARELKLDIGAALDVFERRLKRIEALKPPFWSDAVFSAETGRRFDYYSGFVFELARPGNGLSMGGGGRYDDLVLRLSGSAKGVNAIGAALRIGRLGASS